jgi:hypothetical protein
MTELEQDKHLREDFTHVKKAHMGVGPGWYNLLYTLCNTIDSFLEYNHKDSFINVAQVKEKFGGLRFYYDTENMKPEAQQMISGMTWMAESMSFTICEECGAPGKLRQGGWMKTLCDEHAEQRKKNYE